MSTRWDEAGAAGEKAVAKAGSRKTARVDWSFILVFLFGKFNISAKQLETSHAS